uniref:Transposase (Putative), gypsy type n=1 Tax=Tanacetum cinerariifolium TaxID=118510 RepID=A0A6L2K4H3_TANCI|nr:hypothetical protein [Tanacetum cinerariifolium]
MSFSKRSGKNTPECYTKPLDSLKNWNNRFFSVDERVFLTVVDCRTNAPKDRMPADGSYSVEAVRALDTHRTPIQKQPEMLLCVVGISHRYYLRDELYPTFHYDDDREIDLFNLICALNPTKVKIESRPRAPHKVPLLTLTATRVIEIDESAVATDSSGMPPPEDVPTTAAPGVGQAKETATIEPPVARESRKIGHDGIDANAPLPQSHCEGIMLTFDPQTSVTLIHYPSLTLHHVIPLMSRGPESENASSPAEVGSPRSVYRPEWGVTNGSLLDTPEACQDLVDHAAPPGYFFELRHMHNEEFLGQYNINLARQVAIGSQLCLRFEQEAKLLRKFVAQVATLQEQVSGEEKLKAAFEEFKRYEDEWVEQRCVELDARLDALSIDFNEELYPYMLTAIAGRRWVIGHELRLAMMKCAESLEIRQAFADVVSAGVAKGMSEGLKHGVEHGQAQLKVESIEAYDPEAEAKFVAALQSLKDLKYPLLDQLEGLKDAPIDVIMAALYMKSDTGRRGMPHNIYATSAPAPLSSPSPCIWSNASLVRLEAGSPSRVRGKSLAAIQLGLASNVFVREGAPTDVSDPDPLSFADAPSRHPVDVVQSSQGIAAAGDPESENVSSPVRARGEAAEEVRCSGGSPGQKNPSRELEIKNLEALLEAEADMKKAAEGKSARLIQELEDMRARFSDLQMSNEHLSQQVATLQKWVIGHGLRLAMMKCAESLEMRQALQMLCPQGLPKLEGLKDEPMDVIMAALYLESDTRGDAPQYIRDLRPSSSQLTIPVYPEVRDPRNPRAYKEEMKLSDAIAANISRAEKKKKCRIVCRTHGVGSAHHARSDGVSVSIPTVVPQGLALLLVDLATQTGLEDT